MPEEIIKNFPEKNTEKLSAPKFKHSILKFLLPLVILICLISLAGASFYFYPKIVKPDPISFLPKETSFYLKVKISSDDSQVKNLKELLNRFPYYEKISQKIGEEFRKLKKDNPTLKELDFTISNELILAIISPLEKESQEIPLVFIFPNPDLKKAQKLAKDIQKVIEESEVWKIEKENYKGREIFKAVTITPQKPSYFELKVIPSMTFINNHFFFSLKPENLKKIIDVAEDQKITNIFKKERFQSITSNLAYKKIKKYLPKDYLAISYGEFDYSKILKSVEVEKKVETEFFSSFFYSLRAMVLNLPFLKEKESEKVAFLNVIKIEKDELISESYSLDLRKEVFLPSQFSIKNSLANFIPAKIGNREIVFYSEGKNLKKTIEEIEKQLKPEEKEKLEKNFKSLKEQLGIDLKKDILSLFEKNYAIFLASDLSGKENPILALVFEIDDENKAKENLLKIKLEIPDFSCYLTVPKEIPPPCTPTRKDFSKEIVDGFEIYSLSIVDNLGLNFSIKDKRIIFTFSKDTLSEILKNFGNQKLKDSKTFSEGFKEIPTQISEISFAHPYGFLGVIKNLVKFSFNFITTLRGEQFSEFERNQIEKYTLAIEELLDKGIAPYLKIFKSFSAFSYSPEKGLIIGKGKLKITQLSEKEKRETEEFWEKFPRWLEEIKFLSSPAHVPESLPQIEEPFVVVPKGFKLYSNKEQGYSIIYPENWKENSFPYNREIIQGVSFSKNPIYPEEGIIMVIVQKKTFPNLESAKKEILGGILSENLSQANEKIINGKKAFEFIITPPIPMTEMRYVIFSLKDKSYMITMFGPSEYSQTFDKVINSFTIK